MSEQLGRLPRRGPDFEQIAAFGVALRRFRKQELDKPDDDGEVVAQRMDGFRVEHDRLA